MVKKYAGGGFIGAAGTNRGSWSGDGRSLGVTTGTKTGTSASNRPEARGSSSNAPKMAKAPPKAAKPAAKQPAKNLRAVSKYSGYGTTGYSPKDEYGTRQAIGAIQASTNVGSANQEGKGDLGMRKGGVVKKTFAKKISAEEKKEFKNGKYMGGPAEEKAEKKNPFGKKGNPFAKKKKNPFGKRFADGGSVDRDGTARYGKNMKGRPEEREMPGRRLGQMDVKPDRRMMGQLRAPPSQRPSGPMLSGAGSPAPSTGGEAPVMKTLTPPGRGVGPGAIANAKPMPMPSPGSLPAMPPRPQRPMPPMDRSKIAPMRMAKGGLVKGAGCAERGVKKPRMK